MDMHVQCSVYSNIAVGIVMSLIFLTLHGDIKLEV